MVCASRRGAGDFGAEQCVTKTQSELKLAITELLTAALDQPQPTPELRRALNHVLRLVHHPLELTETTDVDG